MSYRFNPPPGWPAPPEGWSPPEGWEPDPSWPTPPADWTFWIEEPTTPSGPAAPGLGGVAAAGTVGAAGATASSGQPTPPLPPAFGDTTQLPQAGQPAGQAAATGAAETQQFGWGQGSYPSAPAPYSTDPITQPFAAASGPAVPGAAPSYAPGGYAVAGYASGQGALPPGAVSPGPGGTPPGKKSKGPLIAIIAGIVLVLVLAGVAIALINGGGGGEPDPTAAPTDPSPTAEATEEPTDEPSEEPTTEEPTDVPTPDPTTDAPPTGGAPVGYTELAFGEPFAVRDYTDTHQADIALNSVQHDAQCNAGFDWPADGHYVLLDFTVTVPADATEAYTLSDLYFGVYSDVAQLTFSFNGMFCSPENELPLDIQPGATVSGTMVVDIPLESVWLTYDPSFGLQDGAAWRVG